ncbi:exonuclease domain-containing protein [Candidatus Poriferisocius sp.]|uniref:exonuclease domain-containing protein n=1 Tax=Candidatus Poriferisocius sp. TaxID=3101276 RepID=UPI003B5CC4F1
MTAALRALLGGADRLVVVDTETTGVYSADRVIEIALVTMSPNGEIVDVWDSLIQPGRAISATHIHGITAAMVESAPNFDDVAADVAMRLDGAAVAAHNLPFDHRMLGYEFSRIGGLLDVHAGIDTLRATGAKLSAACAVHGIDLGEEHRARNDALATAELLCSVAPACHPGAPASARVRLRPTGRVLRREDAAPIRLPASPYIANQAAHLAHDGAEPAVLAYLEVLARAVEDLHLDRDERAELADIARTVGLDDAHVGQAHRRFVHELIDAALADHVLTSDEYDALVRVGRALDVDQSLIETRLRQWRERSGSIRIEAGMSVVFTGDHPIYDRDQLEAHAVSFGLEVQKNVTKQTSLVAALEPETNSGKAKKARKYGIPIAAIDDFLTAAPGKEIPARTVEGARKSIECPVCLKTWTVDARSSQRQSKPCTDCPGRQTKRR